MDEGITEKELLDKTARKLTDEIQNMSNYKALYNEIQVRTYNFLILSHETKI